MACLFLVLIIGQMSGPTDRRVLSMRIAMLNITAGGMSSGYRKYLNNIIPRLGRHADVAELLVAVPDGLEFPNWEQECSSIECLRLRPAMGGSLRGVGGEVADAVKSFRPDVVFIPSARFWSCGETPVVNMVQNMAPFIGQNGMRSLTYRIRNRLRFEGACRAVKNAHRVVAVSEFVKSHLIESLGVDQTRVGVVYHGAHVFDGNTRVRRPPAMLDEGKHGFVFTAGLIYPYRGLEDIIVAWRHLREHASGPVLGVAGKIGQGMARYYNELKRRVRRSGLEDVIYFLGVLDEEEMAWCYRHCRAFVMSSRIEACPNTALEALANGCLNIAAENPPLPEIFGDATVYYPPGDSRALAERVRKVLNMSDSMRDDMSSKALCRASMFTWDLCCERTVEELQKAIG